jgi:hypothetical protein
MCLSLRHQVSSRSYSDHDMNSISLHLISHNINTTVPINNTIYIIILFREWALRSYVYD